MISFTLSGFTPPASHNLYFFCTRATNSGKSGSTITPTKKGFSADLESSA